MTEPVTNDALGQEFDCLMARAGISIPADRHAGILTAYADLRGQIALLHAPRSHLAEMANVFSLVPKLSPPGRPAR